MGELLSFGAAQALRRQRATVASGAEDVAGGASEVRDAAVRLGNAALARRMEAVRQAAALTRARLHRAGTRRDGGPQRAA